MAPTEGIDAESREEVEISLALGIEEIGALAPDVETVEPNRLEDPAELVIQMLLVQRVVLPVPGPEQLTYIEWHASPLSSARDESQGSGTISVFSETNVRTVRGRRTWAGRDDPTRRAILTALVKRPHLGDADGGPPR